MNTFGKVLIALLIVLLATAALILATSPAVSR